MKVVGAVIKFVGPVADGGNDVAFSLRTSLPNGKPLVFEWKKSQKLEVEVPTEILFRDDFGKMVVFQSNYARSILDAHGPQSKSKLLKFVREVKKAEVDESAFSDVQEVPEPKPETAKKKDKKDEIVSQ